MRNVDTTARRLGDLKDLGVKLAIETQLLAPTRAPTASGTTRN
jgi:hypothetical protein